MKLSVLMQKNDYTLLKGDIDAEVSKLAFDSRCVSLGDVFVCIDGSVFDGHDYISDVIAKGASAVVVQKDIEIDADITVLKVEDTRAALACMSAAYFGYPAEKLRTIGVTGTKGKTTTTYMIKDILERSGYKTGLIGTIESIIGDERITSYNTTPESYVVQQYLSEMVNAGIECVVIEVSSQGLMLSRVAGIVFDYAVFTNLSRDHIGPNEHSDFEDYLKCKSMLFMTSKHAIINLDDAHARDMIASCNGTYETYAINNPSADLCAYNVTLSGEVGRFGVTYETAGTCEMSVVLNILGKYNVYNSLAAMAVGLHFTKDVGIIQSALAEVRVKGRAEIFNASDKFVLIIDYAHNALSMANLLSTLKEYNPKRIITVFGCDGGRDRGRRFEMGEVSAKYSDFTIVTSDNPRFEDPQSIIDDIIVGVKKGNGAFIAIPERRDAVRYAVENAREGDVIILAGKGHENYQIVKDKKRYIDDREVVINYLNSVEQVRQ